MSGRDLFLLGYELHGSIGQVFGQVITRPIGTVDAMVVVNQIRKPLISLAAQKAIKPLEAHPERPTVVRAGVARFVRRRLVPLADVERAVAGLLQDLGDS